MNIKHLSIICALAIAGYAQAQTPGVAPAQPAEQRPASPAAESVAALNKRCPIKYNDGMTLNSVAIAKEGILFDFTITDALYDNISSLGGILRDSIVAELLTSPNADTKALLAACRSAKLSILQNFTDTKSRTFTVTITPDDLN